VTRWGSWCLCVALLVTSEAHARSAAPPPSLVSAEHVSGWVGFGVRGRNNRRSRPDAGTSFERDDLKLDEILHVDANGYVYYARFLRFRIGAELDFLQNLTSGDSLVLPLGDFRLSFLEKKPYGLDLFALVSKDEVEETFGRSFETRVENYGAAMRFGLGPLPFRLGYTRRFRDRTGDPFVDNREEGDEIDFDGTYRLRAGSDGSVRFLFSDMMERGQKVVRHDFVVDNITYFDAEKRRRFNGVVRYYDYAGRSDISNASASGTYSWQHTDRLASRYHADYQYRALGSQTTNLFGGDVSLSHRLYSSLNSSASVIGNIEDAAFGRVGSYGATVHESYSKELADWGRLVIGLSPSIRMQHTRPEQDTGFVTGERVIFRDDLPVQLRQQDIDAASILVTSPDGSVTYQQGFDYDIREQDRRIEIERVLSGTIPSGGEVAVSYRYRLGRENDLLTYGYRGDAAIVYRTWGSLYGNFSSKREDIVSGFSDRILDDRDRYEVGFRTTQRWFAGIVSFDWEETSLRPSSGMTQSVSFTTPWAHRWRGSLSVTHRSRDYRDPEEDMDSWRIHASGSVQFGRTGTFEIDPEFRDEDWSGGFASDARDLRAVGGTASVRWNLRALELRMGVSLFRVERPTVDELEDRFFVQLRRYF